MTRQEQLYPDHTFTIMNRSAAPYIDYIRNGEKKAEVRVNSKAYQQLQVGDKVYFHNHREGILCKVTYLHRYKSFAAMLQQEGIDNVLPQLKNADLAAHEKEAKALQIYNNFPGAFRAQQLGVVAIGVEFLANYFKGKLT